MRLFRRTFFFVRTSPHCCDKNQHHVLQVAPSFFCFLFTSQEKDTILSDPVHSSPSRLSRRVNLSGGSGLSRAKLYNGGVGRGASGVWSFRCQANHKAAIPGTSRMLCSSWRRAVCHPEEKARRIPPTACFFKRYGIELGCFLSEVTEHVTTVTIP